MDSREILSEWTAERYFLNGQQRDDER